MLYARCIVSGYVSTRFLFLSLKAYMTGSSFCAFLGIFSGVTTLSEVTILLKLTNSLRVTTLKIYFWSSLVISVFFSVNASNILIYFGSFLGCL